MNWVDVAGPPGVGKSTLCDPIWGPHDIPIEDVSVPYGWHDFANEITRLFGVIQKHPTLRAAVRMNRRSIRKMATVANGTDDLGPYIQTGFIQRGLGFGWRLNDMGMSMDELVPFFERMPVSIGCVFLEADPEKIRQRNRDREKVRETAHENRAFMVDLMQPAIALAKEVLIDRNVPVITIGTEQHSDDARRELVAFADQEPCQAASPGHRGKAPLLRPPVWW